MKINATKEALEISPNIYKIIRSGRLNYAFQYKHLVKSVIDILDSLSDLYDNGKNKDFFISPEFNLCFIKIKTLILTIEKTESFYTRKQYTVSKAIVSLLDNPENLFEKWKEIREWHIKSYESFLNFAPFEKRKYKVNPYVAELIGKARNELKRINPINEELRETYVKGIIPTAYEIDFLGTTLTVFAEHLGRRILHKSFKPSGAKFQMFELLFENPNKTINRKDLEKKNIWFDLKMVEMLQRCGFTGNVSKAFVTASKSRAKLRIKVTPEELIKMNIPQRKLDLELLSLPPCDN